MSPFHATLVRDEDRLGGLAMKFRGTRDPSQRRAIADDYAQIVECLAQSNAWSEMPPPEDQLPHAWMPARFAEYWARRLGTS